MATNFRVGQKVVCVDDRWPSFRGTPNPLQEGQVYTIKGFTNSFGVDANHVWKLTFCLLLSEADNPEPYKDEDDCGFAASRFRPVVERKTDISIFTDMLIKSKKPIEA